MRVPQFRKHVTGQWFTHWGGKNHYFGIDEEVAADRYAESLSLWRAWRSERKQEIRQRRDRVVKIIDIYDEFLRAKRIEGGDALAVYYAKHLRRYCMAFGDIDAKLIRPWHLNKIKLDMIQQRYAPRTINHDIVAIRVLHRWAAAQELIPPVDLRSVKNVPVGVGDIDVMKPDRVGVVVRKSHPKVRPWLAVTYLGLCRPSETVRLVQGWGKWVEEGVFRLDKGKSDRVFKRHIVLSPLALEWLEKCEPHWSRLDSFSAYACRYVRPKLLQKSAASALIQGGASRDDVEILLGHVGPRLKVTYYLPAFQRLREIASSLTLPG